jgi:hypothetical protein
MMEQLEQRVAEVAEQGRTLLAALREKVAQLNLTSGEVIIPPFESAQFTLEHDLYNGRQTLMASFYPSQYYRAGFLLFHSDGSCFAEYHVMQLHPSKPHWFIEAVEAWVRDGEIKTDTRLARMPQ